MEKKVQRVCPCGNIFYVIPSRLKHGRGKHCSTKCQYASIKSRLPKPEIINWFICENCGDNFWRYKSRENHKGVGRYCSRVCRDVHRIGENTPNFINGKSGNWHGPNWYAQRRKAKNRDGYVCVDCGIAEQESIDIWKQPLHVHHIIPFRKFNTDYVLANSLKNLETLCPPCHRIKDGEIQRMERENV
jgi:5-methylcytosine-specific restriction endonuclease McrA